MYTVSCNHPSNTTGVEPVIKPVTVLETHYYFLALVTGLVRMKKYSHILAHKVKQKNMALHVSGYQPSLGLSH